MNTQLGIIKMATGGVVPNLKVKEEAIKNIRTNLGLKKLMSQNQGQGLMDVEFDHKLCYNERFKDNLFGICQVRTFDGQRMIKDRFRVYCFDMDGREIPFDEKKECVNGFYENCYVIKQLL